VFHVGQEAFDDDDTKPAPCGCAPCLERLRVSERVAAACITRLTSIHEPRSGRWTVYLVQAEEVRAGGDGATEEEAIDQALNVLRSLGGLS
jgi:hypothetical protein